MPVTLDLPAELAARAVAAGGLALRDPEGVTLAVLDRPEAWEPDREAEARAVFGTIDEAHPGVRHLLRNTHPSCVGGSVRGLELPRHYDFRHLRDTPAELRARFTRLGWRRVVAFQTRNPMHRAHMELTVRAARQAEASLLVHPVVGMTKPGDVDHYTRVRCYEKLLARYPERTTALSLLHLAMRMGGPREALWHAIIRKNYGCTHFIVGRDHAGPGNGSEGKPLLRPLRRPGTGARVPGRTRHRDGAVRGDGLRRGSRAVRAGRRGRRRARACSISPAPSSGAACRKDWRFPTGSPSRKWRRSCARSHPPRERQGFTVFFTGLSGAGKSTIANALLVSLLELGGRPVTLLDGDVVRKHLSSELGFSREHRDLNVRRIGYVASEITKNGGVAICAPIAPYAEARRAVREMVGEHGLFIEVHVSTELEVCEQRDRKGLYALARAGKLAQFTGISDPYEVPEAPELRIDAGACTPEEAVQQVLLKLEAPGPGPPGALRPRYSATASSATTRHAPHDRGEDQAQARIPGQFLLVHVEQADHDEGQQQRQQRMRWSRAAAARATPAGKAPCSATAVRAPGAGPGARSRGPSARRPGTTG